MEVVLIIIGVFFVFWIFSDDVENPEDAQFEFSSSFTRFGDPTAPERIVVSENIVTWKKNRGAGWLYLNSDSISIPRKNINNVVIHSKLIGCSIEITGYGCPGIFAKNFTAKDARDIRNILLRY